MFAVACSLRYGRCSDEMANTLVRTRHTARSSTMMPNVTDRGPWNDSTVGATGNRWHHFLYTGSLGPIPETHSAGWWSVHTSSTTPSGTARRQRARGNVSSSSSLPPILPSADSSRPHRCRSRLHSGCQRSPVRAQSNDNQTMPLPGQHGYDADQRPWSAALLDAGPFQHGSHPNFSDATTPSAATAPGLSPLIAVPVSTLSTTTCPGYRRCGKLELGDAKQQYRRGNDAGCRRRPAVEQYYL